MRRAFALVSLVVLTACSGMQDYTDTAAIAAELGCQGSFAVTGQSALAAEVGSCVVRGDELTLLVAETPDDLRRAIDSLGLQGYEQRTAEAYVAGDTWGVLTRTREIAVDVQDTLGGDVRGL